MIVYSDQTGWLANRIFLYSQLIVFSEEYNVPVFFSGFNEYASYFEGTSRSLNCRYPPRKSPFRSKTLRHLSYRFFYGLCHLLIRVQGVLTRVKLFQRAIRIISLKQHEVYNLGSQEHAKAMTGSAINILFGWGFRGGKSRILNNRQVLLDYFKPVKKHLDNLDGLFQKIDASAGDAIIVGVHVRRGDYKSFEDGKYYFEWDQYAGFMKHVCRNLPDKKITFLVCSNESIPMPLSEQEHLNVFTGTGDRLEDIYALARCHFIMGPPSTYSMWASFYGHVPLYMIKDQDLSFSMENFMLPESWMREIA